MPALCHCQTIPGAIGCTSNPGIHLVKYEVYNDEDNLALLKKVSQGFGFTATKVPTIFIGDQYWEGYTEAIEKDIQKAVENGLANGSTDKVAAILAGEEQSAPEKSKIAPLVIAVAGVLLLVVVAAILGRRKLVKTKKNNLQLYKGSGFILTRCHRRTF